jgi:hypothetical protein
MELGRAISFPIVKLPTSRKGEGGSMAIWQSDAVGLTRSRGVNGVMLIESKEFGTLEGVSSKAQRDE